MVGIEGSVEDLAAAGELSAVMAALGKRAMKLLRSVYPPGRRIAFKHCVFKGTHIGEVIRHGFHERTGEPVIVVSFTPRKGGPAIGYEVRVKDIG